MLLLSTKLKNRIRKAPGDFTFFLKNVEINGVKRGCSGFIRNNRNRSYVYVNTERSAYDGVPNYMYRYADNEKDYTGYCNRWADTLEELASNIIKLLNSSPVEQRDTRI